MNSGLPCFVAVPLAVGFLCPLLGRATGDGRASRLLSLVAAAALLLGSAWLLGQPSAALWIGGWDGSGAPSIGLSLVADGLTHLLLITVNVIAFLALLYSWSYVSRYEGQPLYYCLFMIMLAGMNGVVLAGDLFNLFVFMEVAVIASYALVAFGVQRQELEAAFKYAVLGTVSSAFILFAIGLLYNLTGQLNMALVAERLAALEPGPAIWLAAGLFIMGFGLKAAMVPFHAWLPDAHPSAPAPISAMLSGVVIKAIGAYAICRLMFNVFGITSAAGALYANVLLALGALSMVIGVFLAVGQWDFKRLLAYHSISQMGYVFLGLGIGAAVLAAGGDPAVAALAIFGGLFHLINHAAFKSLLFLCSGSAEYATGTRDLHELGGLKTTMPVTSGCCRIAALSIAGVPPFNGFWSKLIIVIAAAQAGYWVLAGLAVFVSFMTLLSFVKVQRYALEGEPSPSAGRIRETPLAMQLPLICLAIACILLGVLTPLHRGRLLDPAGHALADAGSYIRDFRPAGPPAPAEPQLAQRSPEVPS